MAELEVKEQCKKCFHFQVCANVLKQQLYIREKMLKEENPKCDNFVPAADVVEVVRCKDCKYYHTAWNGKETHYCEDYWCEWVEPSEDDFCSLGERRSDNG